MQTNFLDAHYRHWEDANHLFTASRWANADQLYGVAAECGLKLHSRLLSTDPDEVMAVFGPLIKGVQAITAGEGEDHV